MNHGSFAWAIFATSLPWQVATHFQFIYTYGTSHRTGLESTRAENMPATTLTPAGQPSTCSNKKSCLSWEKLYSVRIKDFDY